MVFWISSYVCFVATTKDITVWSTLNLWLDVKRPHLLSRESSSLVRSRRSLAIIYHFLKSYLKPSFGSSLFRWWQSIWILKRFKNYVMACLFTIAVWSVYWLITLALLHNQLQLIGCLFRQAFLNVTRSAENSWLYFLDGLFFVKFLLFTVTEYKHHLKQANIIIAEHLLRSLIIEVN